MENKDNKIRIKPISNYNGFDLNHYLFYDDDEANEYVTISGLSLLKAKRRQEKIDELLNTCPIEEELLKRQYE